jgi:RimJ/RimL family protein N-acetyltransferase
LIDLGVRALFARSRFRTVLAYVKPDNTGSRRAFEKAGFLRKGRCSVRGQDAVLYARSR